MNANEVKTILSDLKRSMRRWPNAGVVAGIVNVDAESGMVDHLVGTVDFNGIHYAALACAALERAIERMSAMSDPPLDLIGKCHIARACLDFEEMVANA